MAGPLKNQKHELFCQALLKGETAHAAYETAGYAPDDGNATRLRKNPRVQDRLRELQSEVAAESKVTVESLLSELEDARLKATSLKQFSAVVRSIESKARISGVMVQRVEIGGPGAFDDCGTIESVLEKAASTLLDEGCHPAFITQEDIEGLKSLLAQHLEEIDEYISAVKAKPIEAYAAKRRNLPRLINAKDRV